MNVTMMGLGYVGVVSTACLAARGHNVWGVDINRDKVAMVNAGVPPIIEPGLEFKMKQAAMHGKLHGTTRLEDAVANSDVCMIAVATPSQTNGQIDGSHLVRACRQLVQALKVTRRPQAVAIRSSILPSTFEHCRKMFETRAGGLAELGVNPEFMREGSAISDFENPPLTIIGASSDHFAEVLKQLYSDCPAPTYVLRPQEALLVKYSSNMFHAVKVAFANEVAAICRAHGVNGDTVMAVFRQDKALNVSARYLKPGFAFGGSCLPKDLRAILYSAQQHDLELPLLKATLVSNALVIDRAVKAVLESGAKRVGLIGLSFKADTDDLRESPFVEVAERLIGKGIDLCIYDPHVLVSKLTGGNKSYIEAAIPHLSRVLAGSVQELASKCDLVVVGHRLPEAQHLLSTMIEQNKVVDLSDLKLKAKDEEEARWIEPVAVPVAS